MGACELQEALKLVGKRANGTWKRPPRRVNRHRTKSVLLTGMHRHGYHSVALHRAGMGPKQ